MTGKPLVILAFTNSFHLGQKAIAYKQTLCFGEHLFGLFVSIDHLFCEFDIRMPVFQIMDDYEDYLQAQLASEMKDLLKITLNVIIILVGKCKTIEGAKRELEKIRVSI